MVNLILRLTTGDEQPIQWQRGAPPTRITINVTNPRSNVGNPDTRLLPFSGKTFIKRQDSNIYDEEHT